MKLWKDIFLVKGAAKFLGKDGGRMQEVAEILH